MLSVCLCWAAGESLVTVQQYNQTAGITYESSFIPIGLRAGPIVATVQPPIRARVIATTLNKHNIPVPGAEGFLPPYYSRKPYAVQPLVAVRTKNGTHSVSIIKLFLFFYLFLMYAQKKGASHWQLLCSSKNISTTESVLFAAKFQSSLCKNSVQKTCNRFKTKTKS